MSSSSVARTALITGASRGLGLALAHALGQLGWSLIIDARDAAALDAARAQLAPLTNVIAIAGDVNDPAHRAALAEAARKLGGLDALVNNASTLGASPRPNLLDYSLNDLEAVYRTNVIAPLALIQTLQSTFKSEVRIINVTSDAGVEPYAGWGGYGSSKAALEHLSAILAAEKPEWRVYWIDPGDMRTQMHQEAFPGEDISDRPTPDVSVPGFLALLVGDFPSGRFATRAVTAASEPSTMVQGLRLALTVSDFERATALYRDGLRLPVLDQWISDNSKGILFGAGEATLEIFDEGQAAEVDQIEVGHRSAGLVRVALIVDDLDTASTAMLEKGAVAVSQPILTPWNDRNQRLAFEPHNDVQVTLSHDEQTTPEAEVNT